MSRKREFSTSIAAQYSILLLVATVLIGFVNIIPSLLDATYHTQTLLSDMTIKFYRYKAAVKDPETPPARLREGGDELKASLRSLEENRFYAQMGENDPHIREALGVIKAATRRYTQTGASHAEELLEEKLHSFSSYIDHYTRQQKFTLNVSLVAALFTLLVMVMLIFYLYRRNRSIVAELQSALEDREYLLKEIHHRVKNNLTMVNSLINLKSMEMADTTPMRDLSQQISTIGMVHELLYHGEDVSSIDLDQYLRNLLQHVFYSLSPHPVEIEVEAGGLSMDPKWVVPLGLIVTEMATNAVKHAFREDGERLFRITARREEETSGYLLTISNSGEPFPEDRSLENGTSMGLELINSLVRQLKGSIKLQRSPMTTFTLRFPG
jgi:two-component sensor histidine kinase